MLTRKARSAFRARLYLRAGRLKKPERKMLARVDLVPVADAAMIVVDAVAVGIAAEIEDRQ